MLLARPALARSIRPALSQLGIRVNVVTVLPIGQPVDGVLEGPSVAVREPVATATGIHLNPFPEDSIPPLGYRVLRGATVVAGSAGAVTEEGVYRRAAAWPDEFEVHSETVPTVRLVSGGRALVASRGGDRHASAIYLGGRATWNWYHWLIEVLPQVHLLDRLPADLALLPILVDGAALAVPQIRETLDALRGDRTVLGLPSGRPQLIDRAVVLDGITRAWPSDPNRTRFIDVAGHALHRGLATHHREVLLSRLGVVESAVRTERIMVLRPDRGRRPDNQEEILDALTPLGFVGLRPELMTAAEQAQAFNSAEVIVGATGAAMSDLIFAGPGCHAVIWGAKPTPAPLAIWANIAAVSGARTEFILVDPAPVVRLPPADVVGAVHRALSRRAGPGID